MEICKEVTSPLTGTASSWKHVLELSKSWSHKCLLHLGTIQSNQISSLFCMVQNCDLKRSDLLKYTLRVKVRTSYDTLTEELCVVILWKTIEQVVLASQSKRRWNAGDRVPQKAVCWRTQVPSVISGRNAFWNAGFCFNHEI